MLVKGATGDYRTASVSYVFIYNVPVKVSSQKNIFMLRIAETDVILYT